MLHVTVQQRRCCCHVTPTTGLLSSDGRATSLEILKARPQSSLEACPLLLWTVRQQSAVPRHHLPQHLCVHSQAQAARPQTHHSALVAAEVGRLPTLPPCIQLASTVAGAYGRCRSERGGRDAGGGGGGYWQAKRSRSMMLRRDSGSRACRQLLRT